MQEEFECVVRCANRKILTPLFLKIEIVRSWIEEWPRAIDDRANLFYHVLNARTKKSLPINHHAVNSLFSCYCT